jgi:hypothetical protein
MRYLPILLAIAAAAPGLCLAQDDSSDNAIHAITAIHEDGTKTVTITDPDKHSSEATTYDARDRVIEKIVYALDDNNSPITGVVYGPDNNPAFKTVYKHDDFNRISEEDDYTLDGQLIRRFTYDFGPDGNLRRIHAFDSQGNELQEEGVHKDERQSLPRVH